MHLGCDLIAPLIYIQRYSGADYQTSKTSHFRDECQCCVRAKKQAAILGPEAAALTDGGKYGKFLQLKKDCQILKDVFNRC